MKQALTANGSIAVWFKSAKLALYRLGVDYEEDRTLPGLTGKHPEYGEIEIRFLVPVQGKTRMEIAVQDAAFIAAFKKIIIPAFKYVSESMAQRSQQPKQPQTQPAAETEPQTAPEKAKIPDQGSKNPEDQAAKMSITDAVRADDSADADRNEGAAAEKQPEVRHCKYCHAELQEGDKICPKCGKKQNKGAMIALIIIGALILVGAIGFGAYKLIKGKSTATTQTTAVDSGSGSGSAENSDTQTQTTTDQSRLVSLDQFNQIENGMSYEQICAIMGREGTFLEPETQATDGNGEITTLRTYYWEAQGVQGANICVTLSNGAVVAFTQYGLK